jgi:hypothetical protein
MERVRQYRGISRRAALGYLEGLGGEQTGEAAVEGAGWRVSVTAETVSVGPTIELTELTVRFEGDEETLDGLIEDFSQKAMRAGG